MFLLKKVSDKVMKMIGAHRLFRLMVPEPALAQVYITNHKSYIYITDDKNFIVLHTCIMNNSEYVLPALYLQLMHCYDSYKLNDVKKNSTAMYMFIQFT